MNPLDAKTIQPRYSEGPASSASRPAAFLALVLINAIVCYGLLWLERDPRDSATHIIAAPSPSPAPSATPMQMIVHVTGAVARPGIVSLPEDSRCSDAVEAAGGLLDSADLIRVNLAAKLADGVQLHIPRLPGEESEAPDASDRNAVAKASSNQEPAGIISGGNPGLQTMGSAPGSAKGVGGGGHSAQGQVSINRASASELEALPGVGPALAGRIVAHRDTLGPFGSPKDLLNVSGIGDKTLARFESMISID